jgi:hypothetical protein
MKTMLATVFQAYSFIVNFKSAVGLKGPCSVIKPMRPEQPGPPLVQKARGSEEGTFVLSTNLQI